MRAPTTVNVASYRAVLEAAAVWRLSFVFLRRQFTPGSSVKTRLTARVVLTPFITRFAIRKKRWCCGCGKAARCLWTICSKRLRKSCRICVAVCTGHGCSRFPKKHQQPSGEPGTFKDYGPGYLHIDCFYLPKLDGQKHYCFVAIDRATRLVFLAVYANKNKEAATDFLRRCLSFYPFKVQKILTDNGREFTLNGFKNRWGTKTNKVHPFTALCYDNIEHRQTKPYTPQTNGMVERANGLIKQGTTKQHTYQNAQQMKDDLQRWFVFYNFFRKNRRIG